MHKEHCRRPFSNAHDLVRPSWGEPRLLHPVYIINKIGLDFAQIHGHKQSLIVLASSTRYPAAVHYNRTGECSAS